MSDANAKADFPAILPYVPATAGFAKRHRPYDADVAFLQAW